MVFESIFGLLQDRRQNRQFLMGRHRNQLNSGLKSERVSTGLETYRAGGDARFERGVRVHRIKSVTVLLGEVRPVPVMFDGEGYARDGQLSWLRCPENRGRR